MFVLGEAWCRAENEGAGWSVGLARGGRLDISACRTPREASRQAQRRGGFCKSLNKRKWMEVFMSQGKGNLWIIFGIVATGVFYVLFKILLGRM